MSFASLNQVTVSKPPQAATELHPTNLKSPINVAPLPPPAVKGHGQALVLFLSLLQMMMQPGIGEIGKVTKVLIEGNPPARNDGKRHP